MTVMSRGGRSRRRGRTPGWTLLTALLILAIVASSVLVFTNRVELLKLAVILSLWAAVIAAFVSVIYRRQSDLDQAKARDLKLVYDLQLDREIAARREHELAVETQLRRELTSELRAQAADEVAALRSELVALRNNLEIMFDADLGHRPALETERTTVQAFSDWERGPGTTDTGPIPTPPLAAVEAADIAAAGAEDIGAAETSEVGADFSIIDAEDIGAVETSEVGADFSIIDVPEEPAEPEAPVWQPEEPTVAVPPQPRRRHAREEPDRQGDYTGHHLGPSRPEPQPAGQFSGGLTAEGEWQPVPAEGQWLPPGAPGSNWVSENGGAPPEAAPAETGGGRHASRAESRQEDASSEGGQHGPGKGQSVADLLARFQTSASVAGGGRRRRREE